MREPLGHSLARVGPPTRREISRRVADFAGDPDASGTPTGSANSGHRQFDKAVSWRRVAGCNLQLTPGEGGGRVVGRRAREALCCILLSRALEELVVPSLGQDAASQGLGALARGLEDREEQEVDG